MAQTWPAAGDVVALMEAIKSKHKRLELATVALAFVDSKAFSKGRFNWGKARKFSPGAKLWHAKKYDFEITLPADGWYQVLQGIQKEAWLDLHLCRFRPEMMPAMAEVNGKQKPIKDQFGRTEYTGEMKIDEKTGEPVWRADPLDLHVFADNAGHYGVWCESLAEFKTALAENEARKSTIVPNADVSFTTFLPPDQLDENATPYEYLKKMGMGMD